MGLSLSSLLGIGGGAARKAAGQNPALLPLSEDKLTGLFSDPGETIESIFKPEYGAPEMRESQRMMADALRANPVPTVDEARRSEDYMRQARRRRGRAASVLAGRSETSTPLGSTGAPPSYGARSVLG